MKRRLKPPVAAAPSSEAVVNADAVLQVKVWPVISPMVWRRVLVPASFTLRELHGVIQVAMGREGIHLYVFRLRATRYGSWELSASSPDVTLADLRFRKGARLIYEYDLNIPWRHEVRIEDRLEREARKT
jgi:pRiA4b ORF-3-like protein